HRERRRPLGRPLDEGATDRPRATDRGRIPSPLPRRGDPERPFPPRPSPHRPPRRALDHARFRTPVALRPPEPSRPLGRSHAESRPPRSRAERGCARGVRAVLPLRCRPRPPPALPSRARPLSVRSRRRPAAHAPGDRASRDDRLLAPAAAHRPARGPSRRRTTGPHPASRRPDRSGPRRGDDARRSRRGAVARARGRARANRPGRPPHERRRRVRPAVALPTRRGVRAFERRVSAGTRARAVPAEPPGPLVRVVRPRPLPVRVVPSPRTVPYRPRELVPL